MQMVSEDNRPKGSLFMFTCPANTKKHRVSYLAYAVH